MSASEARERLRRVVLDRFGIVLDARHQDVLDRFVASRAMKPGGQEELVREIEGSSTGSAIDALVDAGGLARPSRPKASTRIAPRS